MYYKSNNRYVAVCNRFVNITKPNIIQVIMTTTKSPVIDT